MYVVLYFQLCVRGAGLEERAGHRSGVLRGHRLRPLPSLFAAAMVVHVRKVSVPSQTGMSGVVASRMRVATRGVLEYLRKGDED